MTSSHKPTMSRLWHSWRGRPEFFLPALLFLVLFLNGATIGLTDDEAYYWVLAQRPALGYAYHPPAVAWLIAAFQFLLGWLFGTSSAALVRLPGILCVSGMLHLVLSWLRQAGVPRERLLLSGLLCLSFAGIFSLSWMMVPDLPLYLGWTLAFCGVWEICFGKPALRAYAMTGVGIVLALLSKYSAVLAVASAILGILAYAPPKRRWAALGVVIAGALLGALPALVWNARHDWASILWQLQGRHGTGSVSGIRYLRFWVIECLAAGPVLVFFSVSLLRRLKLDPVYGFCGLWALPAALVFCLQPLWSDFKPHWAFIVWWPVLLAFAWSFGTGAIESDRRRGFLQIGYGAVLSALVLLSCQLPIGMALLQSLSSTPVEPRWDVSNDLYGWEGLQGAILRDLGPGALGFPVIGSWYQTASQAAFALGPEATVALVPVDQKARDEWPALESIGAFVDGREGQWPRLRSRVLFVTDNRYTGRPEFPGAACAERSVIERKRLGYPAKRIGVWLCEPGDGRP